jgi:hypothetical protein
MTCPECNGLGVVPRIVMNQPDRHNNTIARTLLDVPGYGDVALVGDLRDRLCPGCRGEVKQKPPPRRKRGGG